MLQPVFPEDDVEDQRIPKLEADVAHILTDIVEMKADIRELRNSINGVKASVADLRVELKESIGGLRVELRDSIAALQLDARIMRSQIWGLFIAAAVLGVLARALHWI